MNKYKTYSLYETNKLVHEHYIFVSLYYNKRISSHLIECNVYEGDHFYIISIIPNLSYEDLDSNNLELTSIYSIHIVDWNSVSKLATLR